MRWDGVREGGADSEVGWSEGGRQEGAREEEKKKERDRSKDRGKESTLQLTRQCLRALHFRQTGVCRDSSSYTI